MKNETKPLTIHPLPTTAELDEIRRMTEENEHSGARVAACSVLVRLFDSLNRDGGNPFRALLAGLSEVAAEQDRAGFLSASLGVTRAVLWVGTMKVARTCGLGSAADALNRAL